MPNSTRSLLLAVALLGLTACNNVQTGPRSMLDQVTIPPDVGATTLPIIVEGDQILVEEEADRPDGGVRKILVNVNLGGPYSSWQEHVYKEVGYDKEKPLAFRLGGIPITVAPGASMIQADAEYPKRQRWPFFYTHRVEGELQSGILEHFDIALDYVDKTLTLAAPGTLPHDGVAVPIRVNEATGLVSIDFVVDGKPYPMVIDIGGGYSWVRPSVVTQWIHAHPDWERGKGAVGAANYNMVDFEFEKEGTLVRLPEISLGQMPIKNVGVMATGPVFGWPLDIWFREALFDLWQKSAAEPVVAWLAANVVKHYRLTIDYKNHMSYWLKKSDIDPHELDQVGVTLVYEDGNYRIGGIVSQQGKPTVTGVEAGDLIAAIDDAPVQGWSRDQIFAALGGKPGDIHRVTIKRGGKSLTVPLAVTAF